MQKVWNVEECIENDRERWRVEQVEIHEQRRGFDKTRRGEGEGEEWRVLV